jgi:hypothetical protein
MGFQGSSRIVLAFICSGVFLFLISLLDVNWFFVFWAVISCFLYFCFIRVASFYREYMSFPASYACTNLVRLYWPCYIYLADTRRLRWSSG